MTIRGIRLLDGVMWTLLLGSIAGCGKDEVKRISCPVGYSAVVVEKDFYCTQHPSTACQAGYLAVQTDAGTYVCTQPSSDPCAVGQLLVAQEDGTYACLRAQTLVQCPPGSTAVGREDGLYSCVSVAQVVCGEGMVPVEQGDGTVICAEIGQIACRFGYTLTQAADGGYVCVQQGDAILGQLSCPAGSLPNAEGTACMSLAVIECGEGFLPLRNEETGSWDCIDALAQYRIPRTVQGLFTDCETGAPLADVAVTLEGLGESLGAGSTLITTGLGGTFTVTGYASSGSLLWSASRSGYQLGAGIAPIPELSDAATDSVSPVLEVCLEAAPMANLVLAGTVVAEASLAAGAVLHLFDLSSGSNAALVQGPVLADGEGRFTFAPVPDSRYRIVVSPYDSDRDGRPDYAQLSWDCGGVSLLECGESYGNLSLVLSPGGGGSRIAYTSLLTLSGTPLSACAAGVESTAAAPCLAAHFDDLLGTNASNQARWLVPSAQGAIVLQSALPFAPEVEVELYRVRPAAGRMDVIDVLAVQPALSADGLTLTLQPSVSLIGDQDPNTFFELRFRRLGWVNGDAAVAPGSSKSIFLDFRQATPYLPNPSQLSLYAGEVAGASAAVVDQGWVHWRNVHGFSLQDRALTAGIPVAFPEVPGAASYRLYARVADANNSFADVSWFGYRAVPTSADTLVGSDRWFAMALWSNFPSPSDFSRQLGFGRLLQLAVTTVTRDGVETPIDPERALTLSDSILVGLAGATETSSPGRPFTASAATVTASVSFPELIRTNAVPSVHLVGIATPGEVVEGARWSWSDSVAPTQTALTGGEVQVTLRNRKYDTCTMASSAAGAGATELMVGDLAAFSGTPLPATAWAFSVGSPGRIFNEGSPLAITGMIDRPTGDDTLQVAPLRDGSGAAEATPAGVASSAWICLERLVVGSATDGNPGPGYSALRTVTRELAVGTELELLVLAGANAGSHTTTVQGLTADYAFVDSVGTVLAPQMAGARAFRLPRSWRETQRLELFAPVTVAETAVEVRLLGGTLAAAAVTTGDVVLIDVDGVFSTSSDRVFATVTAVNKTVPLGAESGQDRITLALPAGTAIDALTLESLLLRLGPSSFQLGLNGVSDTSGNSGPAAGALYTGLFYCDDRDIADGGTPPRTLCTAGSYGVF